VPVVPLRNREWAARTVRSWPDVVLVVKRPNHLGVTRLAGILHLSFQPDRFLSIIWTLFDLSIGAREWYPNPHTTQLIFEIGGSVWVCTIFD
jgi:hypothetical protein